MSMLARYASLAAPAGGIQYVGGNTQTLPISANPGSISLTALTGGLSSSAAEGDLVIVYYGVGYAAGGPNPGVTSSGYTQVALLTAADSVNTQLYVGYKRMGVTPDTTVGLNAPATSGSNISGAVVVHVWRGVESVLPFDTAATTATASNSVLCNPPSITPVTAGAVIIAGGAGGHDVNTSVQYTYSSSDLSNFVTVGSAPGGAIRQATVGVGSKAWTSGAFDPAAFTFSGTSSVSYSWCAVTLALLPTQNQPGPFLISQATTASTGSSSTTLAINKPTGTREGDLMVAAMLSSNKAVTWTGDTGWTEVVEQGTAALPGLRVAYKVAGASEGASYTFTASLSQPHAGAIATYRNGAWDAAGAITTAASPLVVGAVTASVPFSRIFAAVGRDAASITITGPATMDKIAIDANASAPSFLLEQDIALSPAGSSGTRSFTVGSTTSVAGVLASIKPAASYTKYAQYIASTSATGNGVSSLAVNTPACVPGNLLLFVVTVGISTATNLTVSTPSGWTLLAGNSTDTTAYQPGMYVFYRVADGSEAASYTATPSSTAAMCGSIVSLAGVDVSTLTAGTTGTGSATTSITATGVTATANGILLYLGCQANNNQGPVTFTPPSGMTEVVEAQQDGAGIDSTLEVAYQEGLSAGSTGNKTATSSSSAGTNRFRAILVTVGAK